MTMHHYMMMFQYTPEAQAALGGKTARKEEEAT